LRFDQLCMTDSCHIVSELNIWSYLIIFIIWRVSIPCDLITLTLDPVWTVHNVVLVNILVVSLYTNLWSRISISLWNNCRNNWLVLVITTCILLRFEWSKMFYAKSVCLCSDDSIWPGVFNICQITSGNLVFHAFLNYLTSIGVRQRQLSSWFCIIPLNLIGTYIYLNRVGGVMVSVLASSAVDRGFEPWSGQTKDYNIGICCFSANHAALWRKSK
jgi:hypothetical protein